MLVYVMKRILIGDTSGDLKHYMAVIIVLHSPSFIQLLHIFVSGQLSDYKDFYSKNSDFVDNSGKIVIKPSFFFTI